MTTLREAAQQALEALKLSTPKTRRADDDYAEQGWTEHNTAITALRAALAQEQAEPVAWMQPKTVDAKARPDLGYESCSSADYGAFPVYTAPPKADPVQEPVAWLYEAGTDRTLHWHKPPLYGTPLYTTPPQRQPLSGLEVERLLEQVIGSLPVARNLVRAVERAHGIGGQP